MGLAYETPPNVPGLPLPRKGLPLTSTVKLSVFGVGSKPHGLQVMPYERTRLPVATPNMRGWSARFTNQILASHRKAQPLGSDWIVWRSQHGVADDQRRRFAECRAIGRDRDGNLQRYFGGAS